MKYASSLLALGLVLSPAAFAHNTHLAQQAQPVPVTTTDLGDGLYMLQGRGGSENCRRQPGRQPGDQPDQQNPKCLQADERHHAFTRQTKNYRRGKHAGNC